MRPNQAPSSWVQKWSHLIKPRGVVLDVACGNGRHANWFFKLNHRLVLVDRSQDAIESIALPVAVCEKVVADIENNPWPFVGRQFDAVVVTNYLWRPLLPSCLACLATGGVLIYETFTQGNETVGKPSRPDFLLRQGELLQVCSGLRVVAFEEGFTPGETGHMSSFIQRIVAVREEAGAPAQPGLANPLRHLPHRYRLP